jgi:hypothetical protein
MSSARVAGDLLLIVVDKDHTPMVLPTTGARAAQRREKHEGDIHTNEVGVVCVNDLVIEGVVWVWSQNEC